ncbi:MAG: serine/threonine protein kinase [Calditrichaeota bacterium]|nr:serine/threonine protein kinase [Calditrichota bacterium]MCB9369738.1 serine/threonine protein kinase [Calditrichota bacterium]
MHDSSSIDSRYQILRTIGVGGMGVVYLVVDNVRGNQIMALKTLKAVQDEAAIESFRSEFRNIRGVVHPHIPEMFDFGALPREQGGYYFTSEFVDGKPLDKLIKEWHPDQLRTVLVSLCRALAFLHSRGLLHRDLKPDNVLGRINADGEFTTLKLVDFGLAGEHASVSEEAGGTLDYMAPEIIQSGRTSIASDLYALGMLLYKEAVGRLPFEGQDSIATAQIRTKQEPPHPLRFRPDLPVGLADVIHALIQIDPEDRPQSARHVIAMLNERDGFTFDYETAETRKAYISSSGLVTNVDARNLLAAQKRILAEGEQPENIVIVAQPGLGRTRMLKEFSVELTLAGFTTRVVTNARELPAPPHCPKVLMIPDASVVPAEKLTELLTAMECRATWKIVAGSFDNGLPEMFREWKTVELHALNDNGIEDFVSSTFPENSFPPEFRKNLLGETLGIPSALEAALEELVASDFLRIGLTGWEIMPGRWKLRVHRHVELAVNRKLANLSDCARAVLKCLACSLTPLPFSVARGAIGDNACSTVQMIFNGIAETGWAALQDQTLEITHKAVNSLILSRMEEYERKSVHASLFNYWSEAENVDPLVREEELVFHDFLSGVFSISTERATPVLDEAIRKGKLLWARKLIERSRTSAPDTHRKMLISALSRIEYIEGDLSKSADLLGEITNRGKDDVTPGNLLDLSRFASLREKLGYSDEAETILKRCLPHFDENSSQAAGSVYGTLAWIAFKRGEGEHARELAEEGLVHMPHDTTDSGYALLLNTVATLSFYRGDTDVARAYWQRCLEVYEALADRKGIANMYNNLGVLAAQAGDRLRARDLWGRCAKISREIDDIQRLAGIYNNLGIDSLETGNLREAEENYLRALALFRRMESPREQAEILSNLGELAFQRADYTRALAYLNEAVSRAAEIGDQESKLEPMVYMGKLLLTLEELEESEKLLHSAQEIASTIGTRKAEGQAWEGLAALFARRNEFDRATAAAERAGNLLADEADPLALLHLHLTRCQIAADSGQVEQVLEELEQARKVADTKWDPFTAARTQLTESLYVGVPLEPSKWQVALRKLSIYPDLLWKFHWATARQFTRAGQPKKALDEYGRGVAVLKSIAARLPEEKQSTFLHAPHILKFRQEAVELHKSLQAQR